MNIGLMMTNYSKLRQRQAKSECNVVRLYELHERTSQDKNRRVLTFFNLKDDYGQLLGPEDREYNIIFRVREATHNSVILTTANFSHYIPRTKILSPETHVTFENEQQMQMVKSAIRHKKIPLFINGIQLNAWLKVKPTLTLHETLQDKPLECVLGFLQERSTHPNDEYAIIPQQCRIMKWTDETKTISTVVQVTFNRQATTKPTCTIFIDDEIFAAGCASNTFFWKQPWYQLEDATKKLTED